MRVIESARVGICVRLTEVSWLAPPDCSIITPQFPVWKLHQLHPNIDFHTASLEYFSSDHLHILTDTFTELIIPSNRNIGLQVACIGKCANESCRAILR